MTIGIICPTFRRQKNHDELIESFLQYSQESILIFSLEKGDEYIRYEHPRVKYHVGEYGYMAPAVNGAFEEYNDLDIYGFVGDDHRFRGEFEEKIIEAMKHVPLVYGNDLLQGENLPTACFFKGDMVRAFGYICPQNYRHLYLDNTWLEWGKELGILYLPDIIIEHMHRDAGKAQNDENYDRVNSQEMYLHDREAFKKYVENQLQLDLQKYGV